MKEAIKLIIGYFALTKEKVTLGCNGAKT